MNILITIFAVALFGVVYLGFVAWLEERSGKHILMPESLLKKDKEIERVMRYVWQRTLLFVKYKTRTVGHLVYINIRNGVDRTRQSGTNGRRVAPNRNGAGSFFLKRVNEHKQEVRRNEGEDTVE